MNIHSQTLASQPPLQHNHARYDANNQLTGFSGGGGTGSYKYDDNGLRVQTTVNGTTTVSIYSGTQVIAEYQNGAAPTAPTREYVYAGGALLANIAAGVVHYFHADHLSARMFTDSSGNVLGEQGNYPYGETWYQENATTKWQFTTYERDSESGLDYAIARFYNSRVASFCSADPVEGTPDDPQSWNRYSYARNDPVNISDPSGKSWLSILADVVAAILAFVLPEVDPALLGLGEAQVSVEATVDATTAASGSIVSSYLGSTLVGATVTSFGTSAATADSLVADGLVGGAAAAAGSQVSLDPRNLQRFAKAQSKADQNLRNKDCQKFLQDHGINSSDLQNSVRNEIPWNGLKSKISEFDAGVTDPQDSAWSTEYGIESAKTIPVSAMFQSGFGATTEAVAQTPGSNVYFRPGGIFGSGGITPANLIHEALHNLTGLGDRYLAQKLGMPNGKSQDINPALHAHHCF